MIISFSASVTGINTLLSKKFAWKINDLSTENLLDPVLNYTEYGDWSVTIYATFRTWPYTASLETGYFDGPHR